MKDIVSNKKAAKKAANVLVGTVIMCYIIRNGLI